MEDTGSNNVRGNLHILSTNNAWITSVCDMIRLHSMQAIEASGRFLLCLSGGGTPKPIYERLAQEPYRSMIDWKHIHFFWGDERCVPLDHPDSNYGNAKSSLLNQVDALPANIHPVDGSLEPQAAAAKYDAKLKSIIAEREHSFDLVLLGLGTDGHTASLFPHTSILESKKKWADAVFVEKMQSYRVSLTREAINRAKSVGFLVRGKDKAEILPNVLVSPKGSHSFPAQLIYPASGNLDWWIDAEAATKLLSSNA